MYGTSWCRRQVQQPQPDEGDAVRSLRSPKLRSLTPRQRAQVAELYRDGVLIREVDDVDGEGRGGVPRGERAGIGDVGSGRRGRRPLQPHHRRILLHSQPSGCPGKNSPPARRPPSSSTWPPTRTDTSSCQPIPRPQTSAVADLAHPFDQLIPLASSLTRLWTYSTTPSMGPMPRQDTKKPPSCMDEGPILAREPREAEPHVQGSCDGIAVPPLGFEPRTMCLSGTHEV